MPEAEQFYVQLPACRPAAVAHQVQPVSREGERGSGRKVHGAGEDRAGNHHGQQAAEGCDGAGGDHDAGPFKDAVGYDTTAKDQPRPGTSHRADQTEQGQAQNDGAGGIEILLLIRSPDRGMAPQPQGGERGPGRGAGDEIFRDRRVGGIGHKNQGPTHQIEQGQPQHGDPIVPHMPRSHGPSVSH